jgi:two-component system, OmpR family, sensor histidine kinase ArlS
VIQNLSVLHPEFSFQTELFLNEKCRIIISANHLEQVFLIVLDNAIKYSGSKKVIVISGIEKDSQVEIMIKDYGYGIPKSELPHIFDRFYRADKARSRAKSGIGLGLSIASRLVANYNGSIDVESLEGVGTTFTIRFPAVT